METNLSNFLDNLIQLYGDRAGGKGNFQFGGFAELSGTKLVLLQGNKQSLQRPGDWRRFLRLMYLAQRVNKPILLWNIPLVQIATTHSPSLVLSSANYKVIIRLLKLPLPIITVFDDEYEWNLTVEEISWADSSVILKNEMEKLEVTLNNKGRNLRIAENPTEIIQHVSEILEELSKIPTDNLINNRLESFGNHPILNLS